MTPAGYEETLECFQNVSARQPDVAPVWSGLAMLYIDEYASIVRPHRRRRARGRARTPRRRRWRSTRDDFLANLALTRVQFFDGDPAFRQSIERTIALRPNSAQALAQGGFLLVDHAAMPRRVSPLAEKARELTQGAARLLSSRRTP